MAEIDSFVGRKCPSTGAQVVVRLFRNFNASTLQDIWAVSFESGSKQEYYNDLTHDQARQKWEYAKKWWL